MVKKLEWRLYGGEVQYKVYPNMIESYINVLIKIIVIRPRAFQNITTNKGLSGLFSRPIRIHFDDERAVHPRVFSRAGDVAKQR